MFRLLVIVCCFCAANALYSSKRYGGHDNSSWSFGWENQLKSTFQAPYHVSIQDNGKTHVCGGSIISEYYVLTAAQCVDPDRKYKIQTSSAVLFRSPSKEVTKIIRHEKFRRGSSDGFIPRHDIALLKVSEPFFPGPGYNVDAIELFKKGETAEEGTAAFYTGWVPARGQKPEELALNLMRFKVVNTRECNNINADVGGLIGHQVCTTDPYGDQHYVYLCRADIGGALVVGDKQLGIGSWCGFPTEEGDWQYDVYTEVAAYQDWIDENTRD